MTETKYIALGYKTEEGFLYIGWSKELDELVKSDPQAKYYRGYNVLRDVTFKIIEYTFNVVITGYDDKKSVVSINSFNYIVREV